MVDKLDNEEAMEKLKKMGFKNILRQKSKDKKTEIQPNIQKDVKNSILNINIDE